MSQTSPLPPVRITTPAAGTRHDRATLRRRRALIAVLTLLSRHP